MFGLGFIYGVIVGVVALVVTACVVNSGKISHYEENIWKHLKKEE